MTDPRRIRVRSTDSNLAGFWWVAAIGIAPLLLLLITRLGDDNSVYQSMAIEWVRYGKWPYLGSWDQNFPGIIFIHSLAVILFGPSGFGFRLLDLVLQIAILLFLFKLWSLWLKPRVALMATVLYVFYYVRGGSTVMGQRDIYAIMAVLAGCYILFRASSVGYRQIITAGLMLGVAFAFRPTYSLYAIAMVIVLPELRHIGRIAVFGVSSLLPMLLFLLVYSFKPGGLPEFFLATIQFNIDLYTQFSGPWGWFTGNFVNNWFIFLPALVAVALLVWQQGSVRRSSESLFSDIIATDRPAFVLLWVFIAITLGCIIWQHKFLSYHFAPLFVLLTPLAALGYDRLQGGNRRWSLALFLAIGLFGALPKVKFISMARALESHQSVLGAFNSFEFLNHHIDWPKLDAVHHYLQPALDSNKRIEVVTFDARLTALLGANSATRFTLVHPLGFRLDTTRTDDAVHTNYQRRWRSEFMDSLRSVKPAYITLVRTSTCWYLHDPYLDVVHGIPGFDSLLQNAYSLDTTIGGFQVFRRH